MSDVLTDVSERERTGGISASALLKRKTCFTDLHLVAHTHARTQLFWIREKHKNIKQSKTKLFCPQTLKLFKPALFMHQRRSGHVFFLCGRRTLCMSHQQLVWVHLDLLKSSQLTNSKQQQLHRKHFSDTC